MFSFADTPRVGLLMLAGFPNHLLNAPMQHLRPSFTACLIAFASLAHIEAGAATPCPNVKFPQEIIFDTEKNPMAVAVADLNGDRKDDVVVANQGSGSVSVFLSNGRSFQNPVTYITQYEPDAVAVSDFNGDGKPDLALTGFGPNTALWIMLGKGDGSFNAPVLYAAEAYSRSLAVGDLNGDHKPDVVTASDSTGMLTISLNAGDGTFPQYVTIPAGGRPFSVALADFNGDTKLDVAVADFLGKTVNVRLGNGDGTFEQISAYSAGDTTFVTTGDLNGDHIVDIAVGNAGSDSVGVLFGKGDGTFKDMVPFQAGTFPAGIALADFDRNGLMDMVVANNAQQNISVLLADGQGGFKKPMAYTAGGRPVAIATGDFDGDGSPDAAIADNEVAQYTGQVTIVWGNGDGTLDAPLNLQGHGSSLQAGDFNKDGFVDLATIGAVSYGKGDGTFEPPVRFALGAMIVSGGAAGDFDGNGQSEFAIGYLPPALPFPPFISTWKIGVFSRDNQGTFNMTDAFEAPQNPGYMTTIDIESDGKSELAVLSPNLKTLSLYVMDNGRFHPARGFVLGANPSFMVSGDFDGDGKNDVATADDEGVSIILMKGTPQPVRIQTPSNSGLIGAGDFNKDGKSDLVLSTSGSTIALLLSNGDGSFTSTVDYPVGGSYATTADFNGDGLLDLALKDFYGMSLMMGKGDGTFEPATYHPAGYGIGIPVIADFDGDKAPDIASTTLGAISLLFNRCEAAPLRLNFERTGGKITLSWPSESLLESTRSVKTPNWQKVSENISTNNGQSSTSVSQDAEQRYFRLRMP
jgi:hypothetical protein